MAVPPAVVWETLADACGYADWVVGSRSIRAADADWPAPGARLHHTVGIGPFAIADHTESLDADPPRLLELRAKARPLGTARVKLRLIGVDGGTLVRMTENPDGLTAPLSLNPLVQLVTKVRNVESLARLERLALRRDLDAHA